nr:DUF6106 family protein [uncultured Sellimonas sp.]
MSDYYTEQLVKKKTTGKDLAIKAVLIFFTAVSVFILLLMPFLLIVPVIMIAVDYFVFRRLDLEYEYLYVNGDLDIDKIMAKQKRKRVFSMNVSELEILAPQGAGELNQYNNAKVMDFSSHMPDAKCYVMVVSNNGQLAKVIFEPEKEILEGMKMLAPRKVIF